MKELISVILPTYNRAHLLKATLDCVKHQTYRHWECVIVDDGSNDGTEKLVEDYRVDDRFIYIKRPGDRIKGAASCRNIGFEKSSGDYIQYLDSDDILPENKFENQIAVLQKSSEDVMATCKWGLFLRDPEVDFIPVDKIKYEREFSPEDLLQSMGEANSYLPPHTYLIPRRLVVKAGGWNEGLTSNDDAEFMVRVILTASKVLFLTNTTVFYRDITGDNLSSYTNAERLRSAIRSWKLIEVLMQIKFGEKNFLYVENSKNRLFEQNQFKYLDVFKEYPDFFPIQLERENQKKRKIYRARKFLRRIKNKLKKHFRGK